VVVLDAGRIVEDGRPDELLALDGRFARMWRTYTADPDRVPAPSAERAGNR
jgi:ATP-binding cassette subfamily B protein